MKRIAEHRPLLRELDAARAQLAAADAKEAIVGRSVQMLRLLDRVNTIATSHAPVLLTGESGTGKELVARALHERGPRRERPFVAVNCAAFPDTLLEAELFGHERGAFTGAVKRRDGRFRAAARRHAVARRDRRDAAAGAGQAAARAAGGDLRAARHRRSRCASTCASSRRPTATSGEDRRAACSARTSTTASTCSTSTSRRCASARATCRCSCSTSCSSSRRRASVPALSPARLGGARAPSPSPATCASSCHAIQHAVVLAGEDDIDLRHLPRGRVGTPDDAAPTRPCAPAGHRFKESERDHLQARCPGVGEAHAGRRDPGHLSQNLWEKLRLHGVSGD